MAPERFSGRGPGIVTDEGVGVLARDGETYTFQIDWQSSNLAPKPATPGSPREGPDYDYTFKVEPQGNTGAIFIDPYKSTTPAAASAPAAPDAAANAGGTDGKLLASDASNVATTEAEFKKNFENKRVGLLPVDLISDLNRVPGSN